jgi:20S proteasome alpha/beta subunit
MRISKWIVSVVAGLAISVPAAAGDRSADPLAQIDSQVLFKGAVSEADVSLFFEYLRAAMLAAAQGRKEPPPEVLRQRAQALAQELKLRGTMAGLIILGAIEQSLIQSLSEEQPGATLPPVAPFVPIKN